MRNFLIKLNVTQYALRVLAVSCLVLVSLSLIQRTPFAFLHRGFIGFFDALATGLAVSFVIIWTTNYLAIRKLRRPA